MLLSQEKTWISLVRYGAVKRCCAAVDYSYCHKVSQGQCNLLPSGLNFVSLQEKSKPQKKEDEVLERRQLDIFSGPTFLDVLVALQL